jgi:hypothetical protein
MAQRKQRRSGSAEYTYYHFEIIGWDWNYSFSTNAAKWEEKRFSDYRHLLVRATVLRPRRISVPAAELCFVPDVLSEEFELTRNQSPPPSVGSLSVQGAKSEGQRLMGYLSMPKDALESVLQMLIAGKVRADARRKNALAQMSCSPL